MSNVLQIHPYIVLHVPKPKDFQPSMYHGLGFFGGTCPKTKVGTCVKAHCCQRPYWLKRGN
jgi:hypothetical protein